jgi:hypothetical protein
LFWLGPSSSAGSAECRRAPGFVTSRRRREPRCGPAGRDRAHHIAQLVGKGRIPGQFEAPHAMRLQATRPDALHRAQRHTGGDSRCPASPVRRRAGRLGERQRDHTLDQRCWQWRRPRLSGLLAQQASHALAHEPLLPAPTPGFETPARRIISAVPQPSAVARMIRARQTCFCGLFRSATVRRQTPSPRLIRPTSRRGCADLAARMISGSGVLFTIP